MVARSLLVAPSAAVFIKLPVRQASSLLIKDPGPLARLLLSPRIVLLSDVYTSSLKGKTIINMETEHLALASLLLLLLLLSSVALLFFKNVIKPQHAAPQPAAHEEEEEQEQEEQ
eukprot:994609-Pelagomonas_calceolata.AAC.1